MAEGLVLLIEAVVCLRTAPRVQCSVHGTMDGRIMRRGVTSSRQSAATSDLVNL